MAPLSGSAIFTAQPASVGMNFMLHLRIAIAAAPVSMKPITDGIFRSMGWFFCQPGVWLILAMGLVGMWLDRRLKAGKKSKEEALRIRRKGR